MKKLAMSVLLMAASATAMADGVAVSIGQPGFFGQIVLGNAYPAPQVVYPQPVIIQPPAVAVVQPPMYLHVPPGHMQQWANYCGNYGACGRQVYFVQDNWYQDVYSPRYNARKAAKRQHGGPGNGHGNGNHGNHGQHGGPGNGHGNGHDHH